MKKLINKNVLKKVISNLQYAALYNSMDFADAMFIASVEKRFGDELKK